MWSKGIRPRKFCERSAPRSGDLEVAKEKRRAHAPATTGAKAKKSFARSMILPAVRERLDRLLRHPSLDGALGELRAGAGLVGLSGLHNLPQALFPPSFTHDFAAPPSFL